ncbi:MAG: hypothetical protein VR66_02765 [Peptococcaceae bacterium BRH_c23]|nr:MAG: hypothetical protein VR66_02765 [Peptococcaceae bacterium BRH_c23]HBW39042.1 hypothetical protein [Desulfosporosinus sp.]
MQKILPEILLGKGSLGHSLTAVERTMLTMLHYTMWGKGLSDLGNRFASIEEAIYWAINDPRLYQELMDLLDFQLCKINFVDKPLAGFEDEFPLDLYCAYTFDQILVALGKHTEQKRSSFREGFLYLAEKKLDVPPKSPGTSHNLSNPLWGWLLFEVA